MKEIHVYHQSTMKLLQHLRQTAFPKEINFVPEALPVQQHEVLNLQQFFNKTKKLLLLTGAGLSTESGIPDYRSEKVGLYARTNRRPMTYQEFIHSPSGRQRYWARNFVGWPRFASFQPNISHRVFNEWEVQGKVGWLVTQNVDALHSKAGSKNVTELHGSTHRVICLSCGDLSSRWDLQTQFMQINPDWSTQLFADHVAPDGDVLLSDKDVKNFQVPACTRCGGILKPDVIFFGDNVPKATVKFVFEKVEECDGILIAGSSLFIYSGYRFVLRAAFLKKTIAIINIGPTRADHLSDLKLDARCGDVLPQIQHS